MNKNRSKLIAIITGAISVFICILYLLLITVLDFRTQFNDQIISLSENMAVVSLELEYFP